MPFLVIIISFWREISLNSSRRWRQISMTPRLMKHVYKWCVRVFIDCQINWSIISSRIIGGVIWILLCILVLITMTANLALACGFTADRFIPNLSTSPNHRYLMKLFPFNYIKLILKLSTLLFQVLFLIIRQFMIKNLIIYLNLVI